MLHKLTFQYDNASVIDHTALHFQCQMVKMFIVKKNPGLRGSRLRSYAFAVLTRKEYSKAELIEKFALYADRS